MHEGSNSPRSVHVWSELRLLFDSDLRTWWLRKSKETWRDNATRQMPQEIIRIRMLGINLRGGLGAEDGDGGVEILGSSGPRVGDHFAHEAKTHEPQIR